MGRCLLIVLLFLGPTIGQAQRWAEAQLPAPYNKGYYLDIFFLPTNTQYGWACDNDSGFVVRTTNGGASWQGTRATPAGYCHLEYIQFLSTTVGYCSGPCGVFKSTDGGASWSAINLAVPDSMVWGGWFKTDLEGWVTGGGCGVNSFYHTTDGGTSWTRYQDTNIKRSNLADPIWQSDMPSGVVYASGNGTLWKSTNDGASWFVESYTGATSPWQEEISRFGNTFMVSCSQSNCKPDYTSGGMRWSHDDGASWNEFDVGTDMFGCFLLSEQTAWASGRNANVWFTQNGGTSWTKRNCGLGSKHMDDIFFINDSTGWVVGEGLFYLAPPRRTQTDSMLEFLGSCPDSTLRDTVWVTNENFNESEWTIELVGTDAWMYRVANIIPKPLTSCSPVPIVVEYRAVAPGRHTAQMLIRIKSPDTLLVVDLIGQRRTINAGPSDTLFVFNQRAGIPISRVVTWHTTAPPIESIVNIQRDTGSVVLALTSVFPQPINIVAPICQTPITGTLADTGWVSARFKVTLSPCSRDTFITVSVYGVSGIINAPKSVSADLLCNADEILQIPITNTGNMDLTIPSAALAGLSPEVFTVLGMKHGGSTAPWKIGQGASDTLLVQVSPTNVLHRAVLQIQNDDYTTARGIVNPWEVDLLITASPRPHVTANPEVIDLGRICLNTSIDSTFMVLNGSSYDATYSVASSGTRVTKTSVGALRVSGNAGRNERFTFTANVVGSVSDTIQVVVLPCKNVVPVVVNAIVVDQSVMISPSVVTGTIPVGQTLTQSAWIVNRSALSITVTNVRSAVADVDLVVTAAVPTIINPGDSLEVVISFTPSKTRTLVTKLLVDSDAPCLLLGEISLAGTSNQVQLDETELSFDAGCSKSVQTDSLHVTTTNAPLTFNAPTLSNGSSAFTIVAPTTPFTALASQPYAIVVEYNPSVSNNATDTLLLSSTDGTEQFEIPLYGKSVTTSWQVEPDSVDMGRLTACDMERVARLTVSNGSADAITINTNFSELTAGYTVTSSAGTNLSSVTIAGNSSVVFTIKLDPAGVPGVGVWNNTIVFVDATCGQTIRVPVRVEIYGESVLLVTPPTLNAGTIKVGRVEVLEANIFNSGPGVARIQGVTVQSGTGEWTLLSPASAFASLQLEPDSSVVVKVQYAPTSVGVSNASLLVTQKEQCEFNYTVQLTGNAFTTTSTTYTALLRAAKRQARAGDRISIPIEWASDVSAAGLDSAAFSVDYLRLLLQVDTVITGSMPDAAISHTFSQGHLDVMIRGLGQGAGKSGIIAILEGTATPALPDSTLFTFGGVATWSTDSIVVQEDPGLLVVDVCGPRNYIAIRNQASVALAPPLPVTNEVTVVVTAPYTIDVHLELVDVQGNIVVNGSVQTVPSGNSRLTLPITAVASGVYVVHVATSQGGVFNVPLIIAR